MVIRARVKTRIERIPPLAAQMAKAKMPKEKVKTAKAVKVKRVRANVKAPRIRGIRGRTIIHGTTIRSSNKNTDGSWTKIDYENG